MRGPCTRKLLAGGNSCRVEACSCGHVHVTAGPITLRMEPGALQAFAAVLARAATALREAEAAREDDRPRLTLVEGGSIARG